MERTWAKLTDKLIKTALAEDLGDGDITTEATISAELTSTAFLFSKMPGVLAGIDVAEKVFHNVDPSLETRALFKDGCRIKKGQKIAEISGSISSILQAERTALNFLGRMTGIASKTAEYVKEAEGYRVKILDTRKTIPAMTYQKRPLVFNVTMRMLSWSGTRSRAALPPIPRTPRLGRKRP